MLLPLLLNNLLAGAGGVIPPVSPTLPHVIGEGWPDLKKLKKRKLPEVPQWNWLMWTPQEEPAMPTVKTGPTVAAPPAPPRKILPSPELVRGVANSQRYEAAKAYTRMIERDIQARAAALRLREQQEREDEEALLLMGAFDD